MVSGEKEGRWEYSYKSDIDMNGKMEGNYVKGKKEGLWDFKARNGCRKRLTEYTNDKKNGVERVYRAIKGKAPLLKEIITYVDGKREGEYRKFCCSKANINNADYCIENHDKDTTDIGNYTNGKKDGEWVHFITGCVLTLLVSHIKIYKDDVEVEHIRESEFRVKGITPPPLPSKIINSSINKYLEEEEKRKGK
jgi:antitoxin component YwqK of YwqJK toxin-antitoxin module